MTEVSFGTSGAPKFQAVETVEAPTANGDVCIECGTSLYYSGKGRHPKYCEGHKPTKGTGTGTGIRRGTKKKQANEGEWNTFLNIALLAGTFVLGRFAAGGKGLMLDCPPGENPQVFETTTELLAMQPEEAAPLAKLIAKRAVPSTLNKKAGWLVVASLDLEEVGAALFSYGRRVGPVLAQRLANKPIHLASVNPIRPRQRPQQEQTRTVEHEPTGQDQSSQATLTNADVVAGFIAQQRRNNPQPIEQSS